MVDSVESLYRLIVGPITVDAQGSGVITRCRISLSRGQGMAHGTKKL